MGVTVKSPPQPNPIQVAQTQAGLNQQSATQQQELNNVNQVTPQGSLTYSTAGKNPDGTPQFTATQTLAPGEQQVFNADQAARQNLAAAGQSQTAAVQNTLSTPLDISQGAVAARQAGMGSALNAQAPTGSYVAPTTTAATSQADLPQNFDQNLSTLMQLGQSRLGPELALRQQTFQADLAARGVQPGSAAYDQAQRQFGQTVNDQYNQLLLGGQAQLYGQGLSTAQQNQAVQQQMYGQAAGSEGLLYNQQLGSEQANYGQAMSSRQQSLQELAQQRQEPINELTALMSQSQVAQPNYAKTSQTNVAPVDFTGLTSNLYGTASKNAIAQAQNNQALISSGLGALGSLGKGFIGM